MKVEWKTVCKDDNSPFANISGVETFEEDEEESNIEIKIPQDARDVTKDVFDVILIDPKSPTATVKKNNKCVVSVQNDVVQSLISLDEDEVKAQQTDGKVQLTLSRSDQTTGKVVVPWKVLPDSPDSVYANIGGKLKKK